MTWIGLRGAGSASNPDGQSGRDHRGQNPDTNDTNRKASPRGSMVLPAELTSR
jgi:hypothetical protein